MSKDIKPPQGWEVKSLGDVVDFAGGSQPAKSNFSQTLRPGYIRLIQIRDYKSDNFMVYVAKDKVRRFCSKDDVMIGRYGPPIFQILRGLEGAYNVALMKAEPKNGLDKDYLFWFLQNSQIQNYIINLSQRAAGQTGVNKPALNKYPICFPSHDSQKRIVAKIETLFERIDRAIELLKEDIKSCDDLMKSALNEVFEGAEEKGWEVLAIESISKTIEAGFACNKSNEQRGGYVHLRTNNIGLDGRLNFSNVFEINPKLVNGKKSKIFNGDIIFNNTNSQELVGKTCLVDRDYDYAFSNHLTKIRVKESIYPLFVVYYFNKLFQEGCFSRLSKRWISQAGINITQLKQIKVPVPPFKEQKHIADYIRKVQDKQNLLKSKLTQRLEHLKALKASILDSAFRGAL